VENAKIIYQGGKKFLAQNNAHNIIIDLPVGSGGEDSGPTPPEVFIDSLGSCIGVYVIGYCKTAGINTEGLTIDVTWEKETKNKPNFIKNIDVKIDLPNVDIGPRKAALLKVAESCLIHQTIKAHPPINISLASQTSNERA